MSGGYTDSHAHLSMPGSFDHDRELVLQQALDAGVVHLLDLTTRVEQAPACIAFARAHEAVHAAVGIHPHEASSWSAGAEVELRERAGDPAVVAVGEIGLDYHYNHSTPEEQRAALAGQLAVASDLGLPVSVHTREAEQDTIRLLRDSDVRSHGGVIHCFTGTRELADACLDLGMHISFSGIVTFPRAANLREIAAELPLQRLLVETDSPYLAPVPHRGRRNQPAFVVEVATQVAGARGMEPVALGRATSENFRRLFLRRGAA
jgi:TatD DNase family protein